MLSQKNNYQGGGSTSWMPIKPWITLGQPLWLPKMIWVAADKKGGPQGHAPTGDQTIYRITFKIKKTFQPIATIEFECNYQQVTINN